LPKKKRFKKIKLFKIAWPEPAGIPGGNGFSILPVGNNLVEALARIANQVGRPGDGCGGKNGSGYRSKYLKFIGRIRTSGAGLSGGPQNSVGAGYHKNAQRSTRHRQQRAGRFAFAKKQVYYGPQRIVCTGQHQKLFSAHSVDCRGGWRSRLVLGPNGGGKNTKQTNGKRPPHGYWRIKIKSPPSSPVS